jgi:PLP dependent protein
MRTLSAAETPASWRLNKIHLFRSGTYQNPIAPIRYLCRMDFRAKISRYNATLVAVSKTYPPQRLLEEYHLGQRVFGENKVQELVTKFETLPKDIQWHMIGHLQRNKVKYIAPFVAMIHAVDGFALLQEIDRQAAKCNRTIDCLLQFHIAEEDTKFGFTTNEAIEMLETQPWRALAHTRICGVMGMATFTDDTEQVRREFQTLKGIFEHLKQAFFAQDDHFQHISMGMSGDWDIALEEGSTLVRIGSLIFGSRN